MPPFNDHFSSHAASYAAYRPTYPIALIDWLAAAASSRELAVDCGCGSGQLSVLLAERFERVIATDASAQQIANATPHARVDYRIAPAERTGLADASVALVTAAQAAHWFDLDAFYSEVRRVAKPGGALALITYGVTHLEEPRTEAVLQHFYSEVLGRYWPRERRHVEDGYRALPFPFPELTPPPAFSIEAFWALADVLGYVDTWSAVRAIEKAEGRAPVEAFRSALAEAWGPPERRVRIMWPIGMRVGRVGK